MSTRRGRATSARENAPPTSSVAPSPCSSPSLPNCSRPRLIAASVGNGGIAPIGKLRPVGSVAPTPLSFTSGGKSDEGGAEVKGARRRAYDKSCEGVRAADWAVEIAARSSAPEATTGSSEETHECSVEAESCHVESSVRRVLMSASTRCCCRWWSEYMTSSRASFSSTAPSDS